MALPPGLLPAGTNFTECEGLPPLDTMMCIQNLEGLSNLTQCTSGGIAFPISNTPNCTPGMYCPNIDPAVEATWPQVCPPTPECIISRLSSQWCPAQGVFEPTICSPGFYCPNTSLQLLCPDGTFCARGSVAPTHCLPFSHCPPGSQTAMYYGGVLVAAFFDMLLVAAFMYFYYVVEPERIRASMRKYAPLQPLSRGGDSRLASASAKVPPEALFDAAVGDLNHDGGGSSSIKNPLRALLARMPSHASPTIIAASADSNDNDDSARPSKSYLPPQLTADVRAAMRRVWGVLSRPWTVRLPDGVVLDSAGRVRTRSFTSGRRRSRRRSSWGVFGGGLGSSSDGVGEVYGAASEDTRSPSSASTTAADSSRGAHHRQSSSVSSSSNFDGSRSSEDGSAGAAARSTSFLWGQQQRFQRVKALSMNGVSSSRGGDSSGYTVNPITQAALPSSSSSSSSSSSFIDISSSSTVAAPSVPLTIHSGPPSASLASRPSAVPLSATRVLEEGFRKCNADLRLRLDFSGLSLVLPPPVNKTILSNVSGVITPGRVTAVMGPSGAGERVGAAERVFMHY